MQPKWYGFGAVFVCVLFGIGLVLGAWGHYMSEGIQVLVGAVVGFVFVQGLYFAMSAAVEEADGD